MIDPSDNFAASMESSLLESQIPTPMPFMDPEALDLLDKHQVMQEQLQAQAGLRSNSYDDYLPYDPTTGQITGSFFPSTTNIDLDLGYMWDSSVY
jgi:hypothetical protein